MTHECETREYPVWREAASVIAGRVDAEGYGFLMSHEEIFQMLEISEPQTVEEARRQRVDVLRRVEGLREVLLEEYQIYLHNEFARGYRVLPPDEQVTKGFKRYYMKSLKNLRRGIRVLRNVNHRLLSHDGAISRDRNLERALFVSSAFGRRGRLPAGTASGRKLIPPGNEGNGRGGDNDEIVI